MDAEGLIETASDKRTDLVVHPVAHPEDAEVSRVEPPHEGEDRLGERVALELGVEDRRHLAVVTEEDHGHGPRCAEHGGLGDGDLRRLVHEDRLRLEPAVAEAHVYCGGIEGHPHHIGGASPAPGCLPPREVAAECVEREDIRGEALAPGQLPYLDDRQLRGSPEDGVECVVDGLVGLRHHGRIHPRPREGGGEARQHACLPGPGRALHQVEGRLPRGGEERVHLAAVQLAAVAPGKGEHGGVGSEGGCVLRGGPAGEYLNETGAGVRLPDGGEGREEPVVKRRIEGFGVPWD